MYNCAFVCSNPFRNAHILSPSDPAFEFHLKIVSTMSMVPEAQPIEIVELNVPSASAAYDYDG